VAWVQKVRRSWADGWRVCYRTLDTGGKVVNVSTEAFREEKAAKRQRSRIEVEIEGRVQAPKRQQPNVAEALKECFARGYISRGRPLSERKLSDYRGLARVHVIPKLGGRRLGT
jgi:hypothetical protein